ncbi:MAG: cytochrome c [Chlorobi bacterium]|nr:cytochrome c [Chlorobiota bacterium]
MNTKTIFNLLVFFSISWLVSCGSGTTDKQTNDESLSISGNDVITDLVTQSAQSETLDLSKGEEIFKTKCMVCHQATGLGIPGSFPPLAGSDYLLADKKRAFNQVENGSKVPLTVNGVKYPGGVMPPQELSEEDAVAVLNYVYNSWGNKGGEVTMDDVK